jgi:mRNA-degrading endonuclease RelE of RelBE toxin-antitoxin system
MHFLIADSFQTSLGKLATDEQKLVKTTVFDLQVNPANPGHQFHKLERAKDPRFWSVRVSSDIRLIVHKSEESLLLCYVDHHDDAYRWAQKRKLETHPTTGAAQIVEIREIVRNIEVPTYIPGPTEVPSVTPISQQALFSAISEEVLLGYGVPADWIQEAQTVDENGLFELAAHLPAEAAEALLELAVGGSPKPTNWTPDQPDSETRNPFDHPDAQRRFRSVQNIEELTQALDYPWEKWAIFLHPAQRELVERDYNGPARVSGSAGTGKTVVALHRAVHIAQVNPESRVLLTTFSAILANQLKTKVRRLLAGAPRVGERIEVADFNTVARRLYQSGGGELQVVDGAVLEEIILAFANETEGHKFTPRFLISEWNDVIDAWQLRTWEGYRDVRRLGRKSRLPEPQRLVLWSIFQKVWGKLEDEKMVTMAGVFESLRTSLGTRKNPPFDYVVVDESQDISVPQLRFLAEMAKGHPNTLFFAGDLGQRIFQTPFSWLSLGVDIRGRAKTLKINYRTSHQIRTQSDRLLGNVVVDIDGLEETRKGTVSVFNGPSPSVHVADSVDAEIKFVADWIGALEEVLPSEICIIVRSDAELERASLVANSLGRSFQRLDGISEPRLGCLSICTMHFAKGLEFRAVVVMACDEEVIPLQERIEEIADDSDLEEVYNTERHLLYVACTRARDFLLVTSSGNPSEFLEDFLA